MAAKPAPRGDTELVDEWTDTDLADYIRRGDAQAYGEVVRVLAARIAVVATAGTLVTPREAALDLSQALASIAVVAHSIVVDLLDDHTDATARAEIEELADEIDAAAGTLHWIGDGWI